MMPSFHTGQIDKLAIMSDLPPEWSHDPMPEIHQRLQAERRKVWVLDDDPTGTQTVANVPVLMHWSVEALANEFRNDDPVCYLLTNSRSKPLDQAQALNREIGRNLVSAARLTGRRYAVISRSDSTLRGHFPGEVDALVEALGGCDAVLLVPAFFDGGRYTINDVQYVQEGGELVPVAATTFAGDAAFGYQSSDMRAWVEEKTNGRVPAAAVQSLSLSEIRIGGPQRVAERLLGLARGTVCVVNAAASSDLAVFTLGLLRAEAQGGRFLLRTAASIIPIRAGLAARPHLTSTELDLPTTGGGLVIVGSYVPTTTTQLAALLNEPDVVGIEVRVEALLGNHRNAEIARVAQQANRRLCDGANVVIFTSRHLQRGPDAFQSLQIGQHVSTGLVAIAQAISVRPRYIVAKGGITSSDIATHGLNVQRALIMGQLLPGVPVWRLGAESRHPDLAYIVFPGNVGGPETLTEVIRMLRTTVKGTEKAC